MLIAALGVFIAGAAFSLREGITELIHTRLPPRLPRRDRHSRGPDHLHWSGPGVGDRAP